MQLYVFIAILIGIEQGADAKKLIQSNILFRHGHRAPRSVFPKSSYQEWPEGIGQLTNEGKQAAYALGTLLAKRYVEDLKFIPSRYNLSTVYFDSSQVDRCLMSAQLFAAGFFPPTEDQIWNPKLLWQPVPVKSNRRKFDCMLQSSVCDCPMRDVLKLVALKSKAITDFSQKNQVFFDILSNYTGEAINVVSSGLIYDELLIEKERNMTLPSWVAEATMKTLKEASDLVRNVTTLSDNIAMKKILGGNLLWRISTNMQQGVKDYVKSLHRDAIQSGSKHYRDNDKDTEDLKYPVSSKKINFYSAHDVTIQALLNVMGVPVYDRIYYSAAVLVELYIDDDGTPIVEVFLRNHSDDINPISMQHCSKNTTRCTFDDFITNTKNVTVEYTGDVCRSKSTMSFNGNNFPEGKLFTISIYLAIAGILIVLLVACIRPQSKKYTRLPTLE